MVTKAQLKAEAVEARKKEAYEAKAIGLLGHLYRHTVLAEVRAAYAAEVPAETIAAQIAYRSPIGAAVHPVKGSAVERAEKEARAAVERAKVKLEEAGWDLDVLAPYPDSRIGREAYHKARNKRSYYSRLTKSVGGGCRRINDPHIVAMCDESIERFIQDNRDAAASQYDSFIIKLIGKVGEVTEASLSGEHVWGHSVLTVTKADGGVEKWVTQQIVNQSVYGLLFNQWPTRKAK